MVLTPNEVAVIKVIAARAISSGDLTPEWEEIVRDLREGVVAKPFHLECLIHTFKTRNDEVSSITHKIEKSDV